MLFATTWAANDLDRSLCLQALASMRWAYSFSDIRVELLRFAWRTRGRGVDTSQQMNAIHAGTQQPLPSTSVQGTIDDVFNPPPSYTREAEPNAYQNQNRYLAEPSPSSASHPDSSYAYIQPTQIAPPPPTGIYPSGSELSFPDFSTYPLDPEFASYHQHADAEVQWDASQWEGQAMIDTVTSIIRPYTPALQPST